MKLAKLVLILPAIAVLFWNCSKAHAQTVEGVYEVTEGEVTQGSLRIMGEDGKILELPLEHTDVDAHVTGYIARVNVTQHFTNPYDDPIEAVYVFPLPQNAAVDGMTMRIGEKVIVGVIKKRDEAREIYEAAIEAGQTASLLEQERPNIFTQTVGNILPGDDIYIEITYVQDLAYDHGTYEFVFPMVVGPRFIPGEPNGTQTGGGWADNTDQVPDADRITPPVIKPEFRSGHDISLTLQVEAGVPIQNFECPSHDISQKDESPSKTVVEIKSGDQIPNKDFIFRYDVAGRKPEYALLTHARDVGDGVIDGDGAIDGDGYFMLMIQPQAEMSLNEITPRELYFVVDCSGSMSGFPIEKAKEAMKLCIENLHPDDYFQIIKFSDAANGFAPNPVPNTPSNVKNALTYIDNIYGSGGTMMIEGIKAALDGPRDRNRRRIVLFMTDGYIGNEAEILAAIEDKLGNARLFSFGVGSSVNRYLLEKMAQVGRGQVTYCRQDEAAEEKVELFYERISKPYLMDIEIDWNGLEVTEVYPERIPDLFAGQPVIIHGRYTRSGSATITVSGKVRGKTVEQDIPVVFPAVKEENDVIATLWARTKIERLSDEQYSRGEDPDIVNEITQLALEYNLMSSYTSFVAVSEEVRNVDGKMVTVQVPVPMPEGVSYEGVFGEECEDGLGYYNRSYGGSGKVAPHATVACETAAIANGQQQIFNGIAQVSFEIVSVLGGDEDDISEVIEDIEDDLIDIYEDYLDDDASLAGRVLYSITVKPDGRVEDVTLKSSTIGNTDLEDDVENKLERLRFPASTDGGKVIITVAVNFTT